MCFVQKLFTALLPLKWAENMEADLRALMVKCKCGYERSIWEIGGIRWRAVGNSKMFGYCSNCGKRSWHTVYRKHTAHVL